MASRAEAAATIDLLSWPMVGRFLRWRHARSSLQIGMLCLAVVIVLHGFLGPSLAPRNLATVLTWVHYRGLLVVALLVAGNLTCTACPMMLVRDLGRRVRKPTRRWPVRLRGKWIALGLTAAVLFVYEWKNLWASPSGTAWLLLAYFATALLVDLTFKGASFCRRVCPIGQFNFIASTVSPLEVRVKEPARCSDCRTHDCIRGVREAAPSGIRTAQRGCELGLFLPSKVGNLDCTLCLDCVHACPHDNVVLAPRLPGAELSDGARRSGIGRLGRRPDLAALALVFVFGALVNAFGMIGPAYALEEGLAALSGLRSEGLILASIFVFGLLVLPVVLVAGAAQATRRLAATPMSLSSLATTYVFALVPLGFGIWLAHYGFHLLTGFLTVVPLVQGVARDVLGTAVLGSPAWSWVGLRTGAVYPFELGLVLLGGMGSIASAHAVSQRDHARRAGLATLPWVLLIGCLAAASIWVLSQPMEMRGTFL
jgi:ferredoxin